LTTQNDYDKLFIIQNDWGDYMTLQEIAEMMLKEVDRYAVSKEVDVPKMVQARTHKKWRVNKKWLKRYGMKVIYEKKMAKVADITLDNVIEFCHEKGIPLPVEFLTEQND
jgi:hypothetical protein